MAYSKIIITQSAVSGDPGVARNDIVLSTLVTLTNETDGDLGVLTWEWTLIEKPPGSAVTLSGSTTSTATFTPDIEGRYVVSLRVNAMEDDTNGYSENLIAIPFISLGTDYNGDPLGDYNPSGAFENFLANWDSNTKSAQPEIYKLFKNQREIVIPGLVGDIKGIRIPITLPGSLTQSTNSGTPQIAGYSFVFDMTDFPWVLGPKFYATYGRNGAGDTARVRLYDITNSVVVCTMSATASPLYYTTFNLSVGSNPGNLRNDGPTQYRVEVYLTTGGGADLAEVYNAGFIFPMHDIVIT